MPVSELIYTTYAPLVRTVASKYANIYKMVEREDVQQQLWLWFASHPNKVREWSKLDQKDADKLIAASLRNAAYDYCVKEKAHYAGYEPEDNFWYTKEFIKMLLPAALSNDWKRVEVFSSEVKATKSPAESGDWMAYAADVKKAFEALDADEQALVLLFYAKDGEGAKVHAELGSERPTARATMMAANRALNKMVKHLGGFPPKRDYDSKVVEDVTQD